MVVSAQLFRLLCIVWLVLGVFFRFVNLDRKIYWHDESYTSLRISGYTLAEVKKQVFDGHEVGLGTVANVFKFLPFYLARSHG
jgi:uncharacterized membrane protein